MRPELWRLQVEGLVSKEENNMETKSSNPYQCSGCWYLSIIYFNPEDPRIIVNKKSRLGWTMNLARPLAIPVLILQIAFILAPFKALEYFGIEPGGYHIITGLVVFISLIIFWTWMSNPDHFQKK
jgi:protein-S-isoprenylcysteine O-methyltransferase Ste14